MDVLTQEEQKMIQEFTVFNDLYMSKFFEDFNEGVELILRLILDREDLVVQEVKYRIASSIFFIIRRVWMFWRWMLPAKNTISSFR